MGKYSYRSRQRPPPPPPWKIHPVWRGIGCLWLLISPVLAYVGAMLVVDLVVKNKWIPIPYELAQTVTLPLINYRVGYLFANLLVAALLLLLGFALIMVVYTVIYAVAGPGRYGPLDSPPIRDRPRQRQ